LGLLGSWWSKKSRSVNAPAAPAARPASSAAVTAAEGITAVRETDAERRCSGPLCLAATTTAAAAAVAAAGGGATGVETGMEALGGMTMVGVAAIDDVDSEAPFDFVAGAVVRAVGSAREAEADRKVRATVEIDDTLAAVEAIEVEEEATKEEDAEEGAR